MDEGLREKLSPQQQRLYQIFKGFLADKKGQRLDKLRAAVETEIAIYQAASPRFGLDKFNNDVGRIISALARTGTGRTVEKHNRQIVEISRLLRLFRDRRFVPVVAYLLKTGPPAANAIAERAYRSFLPFRREDRHFYEPLRDLLRSRNVVHINRGLRIMRDLAVRNRGMPQNPTHLFTGELGALFGHREYGKIRKLHSEVLDEMRHPGIDEWAKEHAERIRRRR